jgi:hypothetical protein
MKRAENSITHKARQKRRALCFYGAAVMAPLFNHQLRILLLSVFLRALSIANELTDFENCICTSAVRY